MPTANPSEILEATESFVTEINGERLFVNTGTTRIAASHALAKTFPDRFRPVENGLSFQEETATAGPDEKRARTTPSEPAAVAPEAAEPEAKPETTEEPLRPTGTAKGASKPKRS
jgi:hypothetical protein